MPEAVAFLSPSLLSVADKEDALWSLCIPKLRFGITWILDFVQLRCIQHLGQTRCIESSLREGNNVMSMQTSWSDVNTFARLPHLQK